MASEDPNATLPRLLQVNWTRLDEPELGEPVLAPARDYWDGESSWRGADAPPAMLLSSLHIVSPGGVSRVTCVVDVFVVIAVVVRVVIVVDVFGIAAARARQYRPIDSS